MSPPASDDAAATATARANASGGGLDDLLSDATVYSRWWYWIAAVPVYFAVSLLLGGLLFAAFFLGFGVNVGFAVSGVFMFALLMVLLSLPGLALTVLFPLAVYVDARAVSEADVRWDPDPLLYGVVALAGTLLTAFIVSVPLSLYYLYRRHETIGAP